MQERHAFSEKIKGSERYQRLVPGAPLTAGIKSGCVSLSPGESVGEHVTEGKEEVIVVLQGKGELRCAGTAAVALEAPCVAYVPPESAHDVLNTGDSLLKYVFVVSPVSRNSVIL